MKLQVHLAARETEQSLFPACNAQLHLQGVSKGAAENMVASEVDHQWKPGQSFPELPAGGSPSAHPSCHVIHFPLMSDWSSVPAGQASTCGTDSDPLQLDSSRGPGSVHAELKKAEPDLEVGGGGGNDTGSHGMFLTLKDHDHIRLFIQEFTFRGLLPHIEKNIRQLNDQAGVTCPVTLRLELITSIAATRHVCKISRRRLPPTVSVSFFSLFLVRVSAAITRCSVATTIPSVFAAGLQERFEPIAFHRNQKMVRRKQSPGEKCRRAQKHLRPPVSTRVPPGLRSIVSLSASV